VDSVGQPISNGAGKLALLYKFGVMSYEGLAELRWEPSDLVNVIGGVDTTIAYQYEGQKTHGATIVGDPGPVYTKAPTLKSSDIFQTYSPFVQLNQTLPLLTTLHVTLGAHLDTKKAKDRNFAQISPR